MESIPGVISNWHTLFKDFSTSTQEFYAAVEDAVQKRHLPDIEISRVLWSEGGFGSARREYLRVSRQRVAFDICSAPYGGGHFFSWWLAKAPPRFGAGATVAIFLVALILTVMLNKMLSPVLPFDGFASIAARAIVPLALFFLVLLFLGFLVQKGLLGDEEGVMMLPVVGKLYVFFFNPLTYYRRDTAMMFRDSIRAAVNEVINDVRKEKGLRALSDEELRPDAQDTATAA